jgi:hypothetical protein
VSPHDTAVQVRAADIIINGVGAALREIHTASQTDCLNQPGE